MKTIYFLGFASALFLTACGGDSDTANTFDQDAATTTDGSSSTKDTGSSTTDDTGSSTTDTGSSTTDTGSSSGDKGVVNCGTSKCTLPQVCCIGFSGSASYKCAASCSGLSATVKCDGPEDCASGQKCCSGFPSGSQCKASCGTSEQEVCHTTPDCTGGRTCKSCSTPGGGPSAMLCVADGKCPY